MHFTPLFLLDLNYGVSLQYYNGNHIIRDNYITVLHDKHELRCI